MFTIDAPCGDISAEQKIRSSYVISNNQLLLTYEEEKPQIINRCDGYYVQTNSYEQGEVTSYSINEIDAFILRTEECNYYFNDDQCVDASREFHKVN